MSDDVGTPRFALPGTWARIPLESPAKTLASIRRLTERVTGRQDQLATMRAELRARFTKAADVARDGGASQLFIGLELVPGVPLPAWAAVFPADYDAVDLRTLGADDAVRAVDFAVGAAPEGGDTRRSDVASPTPIHAVRHAFRRRSEGVEGDTEYGFDLVEADYWIVASNPNRLALVTFSTAFAEYEEEMLELFDAVVSTLRWAVPETVTA